MFKAIALGIVISVVNLISECVPRYHNFNIRFRLYNLADYKLLMGSEIPFKEFKYNTLEEFLSSVEQIDLWKDVNGAVFVEAVANSQQADVMKLIARQKCSHKSR